MPINSSEFIGTLFYLLSDTCEKCNYIVYFLAQNFINIFKSLLKIVASNS